LQVKRKKCLNETYSRVRVGKYLFFIFPIKSVLKNEDGLSPMFFKFTLEYVFRMEQVNKDGLKLICTHQFLLFVANVNIFEKNYLLQRKTLNVLWLLLSIME